MSFGVFLDMLRKDPRFTIELVDLPVRDRAAENPPGDVNHFKTLSRVISSLSGIGRNDLVWVFGSAGFGRSYGLIYLLAARCLGKKPSLRFFGGRAYQKIAAKSRIIQKFFNRAFSLADRIVVQTEIGRSEFPSELHHLIRVIPGYRLIDAEDHITQEKTASTVRFYYAGLLSREKGSFLMVDAFDIARSALSSMGIEAELHLYGAETDGWQPFARDRDGIYYHGAVTNEELVAAIADYDVLVFPSMIDREGHPGTIVEALFAGIPTICFDLPGPGEIVHHDGNGLVVTDRDPDSLAAAMTQLGGDEALLARLGAQARTDSKRFDARLAIPELVDAMGF